MEVLVEEVFSMWSAQRLYHSTDRDVFSYSYFNVTSDGIRCTKGTQIIKKSNPFLFIKGGTTKEGKNKSLDIEQIYGHGSQWGSMPGVTVLAGCRQ
jgi:hypothetical protein